MATDYGLDEMGSNTGVDGNFRLSGPILNPTQPVIKLEPSLFGGNVRPGLAALHSLF